MTNKRSAGNRVTRVEVIDEHARQYSRWNIEYVQAVLQDNGKTLKIFIDRFGQLEGDILSEDRKGSCDA